MKIYQWLDHVVDTINAEGEYVFCNDDGFLDKEYIKERFGLNDEQYQLLVRELEK